jgi:hypothetical protein
MGRRGCVVDTQNLDSITNTKKDAPNSTQIAISLSEALKQWHEQR